MMDNSWFLPVWGAITMTVVACSNDAAMEDNADADAATSGSTAYVLGAQFGIDSNSGILSSIALPSLDVTQDVVAQAASTDAVLRVHGDQLFVINRSNNNITIIDTTTNQLVDQFSTGELSNPYDIAVFGNTLYVAALGIPALLIFDRTDLAAAPKRMDLSNLDLSEDGNPDPSAVILVDDTLFVGFEHLDYIDSTTIESRGGTVAIIDMIDTTAAPETDMLVTEVLTLNNNNPFGTFVRVDDSLLIQTVRFATLTEPNFGGCLERIDISGTPMVKNCVITAEQAGGFISDVEAVNGNYWLAVTTSTSFNESKVIIVSASGEILNDRVTPATQLPVSLARCPTGEIIINDMTPETGGYRVFNDDGTERTTAALDIGLPPSFSEGIACR